MVIGVNSNNEIVLTISTLIETIIAPIPELTAPRLTWLRSFGTGLNSTSDPMGIGSSLIKEVKQNE